MPSKQSEERHCGDCGAAEGQFHHPGCDMEICPFCGGQLISCDCCYEKLNIDCSPGSYAYKNGLTPEQELKWDRLLKRQGLVRFIRYPLICARCGELWPKMFMVSDAEWEFYIDIRHREELICWECYQEIRNLVDRYSRKKHPEWPAPRFLG